MYVMVCCPGPLTSGLKHTSPQLLGVVGIDGSLEMALEKQAKESYQAQSHVVFL